MFIFKSRLEGLLLDIFWLDCFLQLFLFGLKEEQGEVLTKKLREKWIQQENPDVEEDNFRYWKCQLRYFMRKRCAQNGMFKEFRSTWLAEKFKQSKVYHFYYYAIRFVTSCERINIVIMCGCFFHIVTLTEKKKRYSTLGCSPFCWVLALTYLHRLADKKLVVFKRPNVFDSPQRRAAMGPIKIAKGMDLTFPCPDRTGLLELYLTLVVLASEYVDDVHYVKLRS